MKNNNRKYFVTKFIIAIGEFAGELQCKYESELFASINLARFFFTSR